MEEVIRTIFWMDGEILLLIQEYIRKEWMDGFWCAVTHLGDSGWFWILLGLLLLFWKKTRRAGAAALGAMGIGALLTNIILKNLIGRTRPYEVVNGLILLVEKQHDFSFPSGHACASFAAASALYRFLPGKWGVPWIVLAVLIAVSRLYVGVHYPTDVLAGAAVGIFSAWLIEKVSHMIMKRKKRVQDRTIQNS